jgi:2-haloacid dehalogenase
MALSDVKALTFDVFGTVVNWRDSVAREAKIFLGPKGYDKDWHAFADQWRARYQPAMDKVRKGERPWARLDDLHRENLAELLKEFGIAGLSEGEIDHLNRRHVATGGRTISQACPASTASSASPH